MRVRRTAAVLVLLLMHTRAEPFVNSCHGLRPVDRQLIQKLRARVCCG
jgi:hypothetical protein